MGGAYVIMGPRLPPELGYGPSLFPSGGQGNLSELPNLRPIPDFPGAPRNLVNINGERVPITDVIEMPEIGYNPAAQMQGPIDFNPDFIGRLGLTGMQAALLVGGAITAFILPGMMSGSHAKIRDTVFIAGMGAMAAGGIWAASNWLKVQSPIVAKSAFINPSLLQNTQVHTQRFSNPVNDLDHIKPENRFDLQTNYVMNKPDDSFDSRINDLILKEAKNLGFGTAGNYPVKMEPWKIKTLNPTTQTEPARDFNTVKMIS